MKWKPYYTAALALLLVLVGLRAFLPSMLKHWIEAQSEDSGPFQWKIADIDLHLWRLGYDLQDATLTRKSSPGSKPVFAADLMTSTLHWAPFSKDAPTMDISASHPRLNIVRGSAKGKAGKGTDWPTILHRLTLFRMGRLDIRDGEVHYRDPQAKPPVHLSAQEVKIEAENLFRGGDDTASWAELRAQGIWMGSGRFRLRVRIHPEASRPEFDLEFSLRDMDLTAMNAALRAYAGVKASSGHVDIGTRISASGGRYHGTIHSSLRDFEIAGSDNKEKGLIETVKEKVIGLAGNILEKKSEENQAQGKAPPERTFSGRFSDDVQDVWSMSEFLIEESFRRALKP